MDSKTSKGRRGKNSADSPTASPSIVEASAVVQEVANDGLSQSSQSGSNDESIDGRHPIRGNAPSQRVIAARQYFLFGDESGNRIIDPKQLADKVGCHFTSILRHIPSWSEEYEQMLIGRNGCEWKIALTEQTLTRYKNGVALLERQADQIEAELEAYGESVTFLRELLRKFDFQKGDAKEALSAIQTFLQTVGSEKFLREHWMKVHKFWIETSGMQSRISVAEIFEKEVAKDTARRKGKGTGEATKEKPVTAGGGFFDF